MGDVGYVARGRHRQRRGGECGKRRASSRHGANIADAAWSWTSPAGDTMRLRRSAQPLSIRVRLASRRYREIRGDISDLLVAEFGRPKRRHRPRAVAHEDPEHLVA